MNKKGIASTTLIYSFFIVFLLLLITIILDFSNKKFLLNKIKGIMPPTPDYSECNKDDSLSDCLFKMEYKKYGTFYLEDKKYDIAKVKATIGKRSITTLLSGASKYEGMFAMKDDWGLSYFYRGNGNNNYVQLAGLKWQIVRINGDGSIRLILADAKDYNIKLKTPFDIATGERWSTETTKKALLGLKHTSGGSGDWLNRYDMKYANDENSTILNKLNEFYNTYLKDDYDDIMKKDQIFCSEKFIDEDQNLYIDKVSNGWAKCDFYNLIKSRIDELNYTIKEKVELDLALTTIGVYCAGSTLTQSINIDYYPSYGRYLNNGVRLSCRTGNNANLPCHQAMNLGIYSVEGKVKYNVDSIGKFADCAIHPCDRKCGLNSCHSDKDCTNWKGNINYNKLEFSALASKLEELYTKGQAVMAVDSDYNNYKGNGQLDYPIGLITMDEAVLSGVKNGKGQGIANSSAIQSSELNNYWTMSIGAGDYNNTLNSIFYTLASAVANAGINRVYSNDTEFNDIALLSANYYWTVEESHLGLSYQYSKYYYARPVINIYNVNYYDGTGTSADPYILSYQGNKLD